MTNAATDEVVGKPGPADLLEIFYAPRAVFARRRGGEFGLPLVALVVIVAIVTVATASLMQPLWDAMIAKGIATGAASMTPAQMETAKSFGEKITMVGQPITFLILPFVIGLLIWLVGKFAGVKQGYGVAVMIATLALFPRIIGIIAAAVEAAFMPDSAFTSPMAFSIGPARFVDATHAPVLAAVLSRFDLFTLWSTLLIGIGVMVTARATRQQAWITAVGVWLIAFIPALWGALRTA
jgi:hypothetical protein